MTELSAITLMPLVGTGAPVTLPSFAAQGWSFRDLVDWWGTTPAKGSPVERPQGHGAFEASQSLRSSRAISITANYIGESQAEVEDAFDTLSAVGAEGPVLMTVTTPAGSSHRVVTIEDTAPTRHRGGSPIGGMTVDMIARDPRRYSSGEWLSTPPPSPGQGLVWPVVWPAVWPGGGSSGRVELANAGKAPSAPVFRLLGGFESAVITCVENGRRIGFARPVPAGSMVEIDVKTKRALLDGQSDVSRWLRFREWTEVPGLLSRTFQFDADGGEMIAKVDHAWW
jgi:hypothetical protein